MPQRPPRPKAPPTTGLDIATASGAKVVIGTPGDTCCYDWRRKVIVLTPAVAFGTDTSSLMAAAEEAEHHRQPRWLHALRIFDPARWFAEADAFLRVKRFFGLKC